VRGLALTIGLCAVLVAGGGCTADEDQSDADARPPGAGPDVARAITPRRLKVHLLALAAIARRNGGSREVGGPGYRQSVAYVAGQLRAAGYRPRLLSFPFSLFRETRPPRFERVASSTSRLRERR